MLRVQREGVLVDTERAALLRPAGGVAIAGRQRRGLPGVPLRYGPVADRLHERRRRPVGVGHGEGLVRLAAVDPGRQQLQRAGVARGQGDGLAGGADDVVGPGGAEVEGGAADGQARPEQAGGEGIAVAVETAPAECRPVDHDPRPVEGRGDVDRTGVSKPRRRNVVDADLIEQGGVVGPGGIDADEGDGVAAGRHLERGGRVGGVAGAGRGENVHHRAVHLHLDLLVAGAVVAPLGGADADLVGTGHREIHHLADRASLLEEGDLAALRGAGVAAGEAAAVARHAGPAAEAPRRARRIILVGRPARPQDRVFKPGVEEVGGGAVEGAHEVGAILIASHLLHISLGAIGEHLD